MLKIGIQFFAHKKGGGSTKNGRDSESKRLGVKRADGRLFWLATSWSVREAPTSIPAPTWASAAMTHCSLIDGTVRFERKGKDRKQCCVYAEQ